MEQKSKEQQIQEQIALEQYEVLRVLGQLQQIEILRLHNGEVIVRKNYTNIPNQFENEHNAIESLQQRLKNSFKKYLPIVYDMCTRYMYIYMEKMDADFFDILIKNRGQYDEQFIKGQFFQIFQGVQILHQNNFIHGDLKLENFIVKEESGRIKICDFGHSTEARDSLVDGNRGTTRYTHSKLKSAIQFNPELRYDGFKFDVFALGITLFESLILEEFKQTLLNFLPNNVQKFWERMFTIYPGTQEWSKELQELFVNLVNPVEQQRYTIDQALLSPWITSLQDEEMDEECNLNMIQDNQQLIQVGTDDRGTLFDTQQALQQAIHFLRENVETEEFSSFLCLENNRIAQKIPLEIINKTSFKSQLNPKDLLIIIVKEGDNIASNWKEEGFLDEQKYIINAEFKFPVTKYTTTTQSEEQDDNEDDEDEEYIQVNEIHPLKFTMQIWSIKENEFEYKSWIEFTNLNDDSYLYYYQHINNIQKIIKQY